MGKLLIFKQMRKKYRNKQTKPFTESNGKLSKQEDMMKAKRLMETLSAFKKKKSKDDARHMNYRGCGDEDQS